MRLESTIKGNRDGTTDVYHKRRPYLAPSGRKAGIKQKKHHEYGKTDGFFHKHPNTFC